MSANTILIPVDGSTFGEWAVPMGLGLARRMGAQVELVTVVEAEPRVGGWLVTSAGLEDWFRDYHEDLRSRIGKVSEVPVTSSVVLGAVPKRLENYIEESRPELVVMATHGRGPMSRAWLGSVADRLVRHVTMPVMLVRPGEKRVELAEAPRFRRILLPLDGSERAEESVTWALRVGQDRCAEYLLLRAVPPLFPLTSSYLPHAIEETKEVLEHGRLEAEEYLGQWRQRLQDEELRAESEVLVGVQPGPAIVRFAEERAADLIVIATHGRRGLTRLVLGSVADKVVRASPVPVLIHRPPDA